MHIEIDLLNWKPELEFCTSNMTNDEFSILKNMLSNKTKSGGGKKNGKFLISKFNN